MVNQVYVGSEAMPKIKKAAVEVVKNLNTKLVSGNPLTFKKLLQLSFTNPDGSSNEDKVQKIMKSVGNMVEGMMKGGNPFENLFFRKYFLVKF